MLCTIFQIRFSGTRYIRNYGLNEYVSYSHIFGLYSLQEVRLNIMYIVLI